MSQKALSPTLWRTCRALANRTRLEIIRELINNPGLTVSCIARRNRITVSSASINLRALNARGIIRSKRKGKHVFYTVASDPSVAWTELLVKAIQRTFANCRNPCDLLYRQATAFTHPRRITICRALLSKGPLAFEQLVSECRISRQALTRHLDKLRRRGIVSRKERSWAISAQKDLFSKALLKIVAEQEQSPVR